MTRIVDGMGYPVSAGNQQLRTTDLDDAARRHALANLTALGGADLGAVLGAVLGLCTEPQAERLAALWADRDQPAATPPDPAGCADCGRTAAQQRGCGICWARTWREEHA